MVLDITTYIDIFICSMCLYETQRKETTFGVPCKLELRVS